MTSKEQELAVWITDFTEAKVAVMNIGLLFEKLYDERIEVITKLQILIGDYSEINKELESFQTLSQDLLDYSNSLTKAKDATIQVGRNQLNTLQAQIQTRLKVLEQLKGFKSPMLEEKWNAVEENMMPFYSFFDTFLTRFALKLELQQADFARTIADIFRKAHINDSIPTIDEVRKVWFSQFESVMLAVEAMKHIEPHVSETYARLKKQDASPSYIQPFQKLSQTFSKEARDPEFSDSRKGFFYKYGYAPPNPERQPEYKVAAYDFEATDPSDLSFKKGDKLIILDRGDDPNWWLAQLNGSEGLVPFNYLVDEHDINADDDDVYHAENEGYANERAYDSDDQKDPEVANDPDASEPDSNDKGAPKETDAPKGHSGPVGVVDPSNQDNGDVISTNESPELPEHMNNDGGPVAPRLPKRPTSHVEIVEDHGKTPNISDSQDSAGSSRPESDESELPPKMPARPGAHAHPVKPSTPAPVPQETVDETKEVSSSSLISTANEDIKAKSTEIESSNSKLETMAENKSLVDKDKNSESKNIDDSSHTESLVDEDINKTQSPTVFNAEVGIKDADNTKTDPPTTETSDSNQNNAADDDDGLL